LTLGGPQFAEWPIERKIEPDAGRDRRGAHANAPRARPQTEGAAAKFAENEILGDRQGGDSQQFGRLMNGDDARLMRRQRRGEANRAPGDDKLAGVGRNDAGGDFCQTRYRTLPAISGGRTMRVTLVAPAARCQY
jgi:hypothetical protein